MKERILKSMPNYSLKRLGSKLFNAFTIDGGDNYLELNFIHQDTNQHYSVTVKPTGKITQGQKNILLTKRIAELEHYNVGLADESCQQQRRIAELEKENKLLKQVEQIFNDSPDLEFSRFKEMFPSEFKAHNLEQQAIGRLHGVAYALNMYCTTMPPKEFPAIGDYYANKLKAEALKDQE